MLPLLLKYRPGQDDIPALEVIREVRDLVVSEVRTSLLSGVFADRPSDLVVSGEVRAGVIRLTVEDIQAGDRFSRGIPLEELENPLEDPAPGSVSAVDVPDAPPAQRLPGPGRVNDEGLRTPRVQLFRRQTESQFRGERRSGELSEVVRDRVRGLAHAYISEYMRVKARRMVHR